MNIKILFTSDLYPANVERETQQFNYALHHYVREWRKTAQVVVINTHSYNILTVWKYWKYNYPDSFLIDEVQVYNRLVLRLPGGWLLKFPLLGLANKLSFDVVVGHMPVGSEAAKYIANHFKKPYCVGLHYTDYKRSKLKEGGLSSRYVKLLQGASLVIYRSQTLQRLFSDKCAHLINKSFVATGGVDDLWLSQPVLHTFEHLSENVKFVSVARLIALKNLNVVIQSLHSFSKRNFQYSIIGEGSERGRLEELMEELSMKNSVILHGWLPTKEIIRHLDNADIMILISRPETFGLVYLEAMARGCLVVGTKGEGIDGIIVNGVNGFLCDPDVNSLLLLINKVIDMSLQELKLISNNAKKTANAHSYPELSTKLLRRITDVIS